MKVLSLFDGMACGALALQEADIPIEEYNAFEIDEYCIKTVKHNFPFVKHYGDVFKADFERFRGSDILIGGSPCTYWSICKTKERETTASGLGWDLFCQYLRALREAKPKYFVYENNASMSKEIRAAITKEFGFEPTEINSALVSAQSRKRLYWVGKLSEGGYKPVKIVQPEDRGIMLKDILEIALRDKARTVTAFCGRTTEREFFKKHQGNMTVEPIETTNGKARTIKAQYAKNSIANFTGNYKTTGVAERVGTLPTKDGRITNYQSKRVYSDRSKSVTVKAGCDGEGARSGLYALSVSQYAEPTEFKDGKPIKAKSYISGKEYVVYEVKDGYFTYKDKKYPLKVEDGFYIIRKLTVDEVKLLQTVPLDYDFPVSDTQAYKMLGNGWTVEVIVHIFKAIKDDINESKKNKST